MTHHSGFTAWPDDAAAGYRKVGLWQGETLGAALARWAREHGPRPAVTDHAGSFTFAELDRRADQIAGGLHALGIRRGDRVLVQLPNTAAFVATSFALLRMGALPIFALPAQRLKDLDALSKVAEPVAYICQAQFMGFDYRAMGEELLAANPFLRHLVIDGDHGPHVALQSLDTPFDAHDLPVASDIACLLLSGGTTGTPKLIPRTHDDYALNARAAAGVCGLDRDSVYLAALPAAHNFTLSCPGIIGTLSHGGRVVMARTPAVDEAFLLIEKEGVTITALVPALVPLWLQQREWDPADLSSLKLLQVGGARLAADIAKTVAPVLGCRLQQVFGMAEGLICMTDPDDATAAIDTQGRPLCPQDEVRIVAPDGTDLPDGTVGELLVRGPYTIRGYYQAPDHNRTAFTADGFYRSGDLVRRDAGGNMIVEGRAKEQINRAGEKIASAEIEDMLRQHPAVRDAVVMGVPDATLGERSCAVIIPMDARPTLATLRDFLRMSGLAQFKLPDELRFARDWPLTPIGKIDRRRLAAMTEGKRRFAERRVAFSGDPLATAAMLAKGADIATVYERDGEWSVALGSLAAIALDGTTPDFAAALEDATRALPFDGWRLYGSAEFELARHIHGLPLADPDRPLIRLDLPRMEYRLRQGQALLRALDPADLDRMAQDLTATPPLHAPATEMPDLMRGADAYKRAVAAAVTEIGKGAYQKVILSRSVALDHALDMPASYVAGRRRNQPARSFMILRPDFQAAGFSPETVVEVTADRHVATQPLAGTRAFCDDPAWNAALKQDLLTDPKEIAEHAVSVKLAHEELGAICAPETILIPDFMTVIRRGSVQHLASRLEGDLRDGAGRWDAVRALFPAVTASGIAKREAIDAIGRHEPGPRGLYSGAVMIADQDGALDAALVLRAIYQQGGKAWLRAGAGIVSLSDPERELTETCEKLGSVARNLVPAAHAIPTAVPQTTEQA